MNVFISVDSDAREPHLLNMFTSSGEAPVQRVVARRAARVGFGATLIAGAAAMVGATLDDTGVLDLPMAHWFAIVWAAAVAVGAVAWLVARRWPRVEPDSLAVVGLTVPAIGLALMAPLTLQLPIVLWVSGVSDFDDWVQLSVAITGVAHLALALLSAVRAHQLARDTTPMAVSTIFAAVVVVSMIPFIVLYLIPPILVAITGAAYLPLLYAPAWIARRERALLSTTPPLARAIAA